MNALYSRCLALTLCFPLLSGIALANAQPTHEFTLDNGLKVVVREDHRAPIVVSQVWYRIGSSYETSGFTGLSHILEHMMFKGSSKLGPGQASLVLRDLGAEENAFTSTDYTAYYQILARNRLPVALEMEADRMATLTLPEDEYKHEIEVIKEERRLRTDDNPESLAYECFQAAAYPASGYRNPTIGWRQDLDRIDIHDVRDWYRRWYAPNNATLVIVGDITLNEAKKEAERWFGKIPRRELPAIRRPLELPVPGERHLTLHVRTQLPSLIMAFNVPSLSTASNKREAYALRMIAAILSGGYSTRLPAKLERGQELVTDAGAWYAMTARGDTLFTLGAAPNTQKNRTLKQVEEGLWQQLEKLKETPPSKEEMERVKAQTIAQLVYSRDSISGQATSIGTLESVGLSWKLLDEDLDNLSAVTPDDIQKAARAYFTRDRMTLARILPEESQQ